MRTVLKHLIAAIVASIMLTSQANGFGPYAHYTASPSSLSQFANLPDLELWGSPDRTPWAESIPLAIGIDFVVSPNFGWCHGCQTKGVLPAATASFSVLGVPYTFAYLHVPMTPTDYKAPQGVELPGEDMYYLCRNKLQTRPLMSEMLNTARGFACHNTEDSVVHFSYFKGGSDPSIPNPAWAWVVEHGLKEMWAEYVLFQADGGSFDLLTGTIKPPTTIMFSNGDAGIILLAQKVYRKNCQKTNLDGHPPATRKAVDTRADIASSIHAKDIKLMDYLDKFNWTTWQIYDLLADMSLTSWVRTDVVTKRTTAATLASSVAASMP